MSYIDHYDIITGRSQSSTSLRVKRWPKVLREFVTSWEERRSLHRSRKALSKMEDHLLDDIGLSREQAEREAHKGFFE